MLFFGGDEAGEGKGPSVVDVLLAVFLLTRVRWREGVGVGAKGLLMIGRGCML